MPLRLRASKKFRNFNMPVSYKVGAENRLKDARNVYSNQDVLETRHGISRWNSTAFSAAPQSISYYKDDSGNRKLIVKDGSTLYNAQGTGAHSSIKTGLTDSAKHRAITYKGRHIIVSESDGFFQYDGTTFTQLGQAGPSAPTLAASGSGNTLTASDYQVATTFYDSATGFESNIGTASSTVTVGSGQRIDVTGIASSADNAFIDKVRVYLKDITNDGDWIFWDEISLGTTTETIDSDPTSAIVAPETNGEPPSTGGAKYIVLFGNRVALLGNATFPSDVYLSEEFLAEAYDRSQTDKTFNMAGNGPITGGGAGYYNDGNQSPYLCVFKERSIIIYTEISGSPQIIQISNEIGCISHDTIKTINGDVFFMSHKGWHVISNGQLVRTKDDSNSIDNGDIEDIFTRSGFEFELNKNDFSDYFSVYYPTLNQYMTFVSEGSNANIYKSYNYEFGIGGFRPYDFQVYFTGAVLADDGAGDDVIYLVGENGYIYSHSINETVGTDVDRDGNSVAIPAFIQLYWVRGDDLDANYNFGPFVLRALNQANPVTVKVWVDYIQQNVTDISYDFSTNAAGFVLDVSQLDIGVLGDGRDIVRYVGEILKSSQSLLLGIYKEQMGESMAILEGQIDYSKNGAPL